MKWTARMTVAAALAACLVVVLIGWMLWPQPTPPAGSSAPLAPAREQIEAGPMIEVEIKAPVKASPPAIKRKIGLPDTVQADTDQHVLATARLVAEARPYTVSAVLDAGTGSTTIYTRPDPLPWFGLESTGAVGIYAGLRDDGQQIVRMTARRDLVRVKDIHAGIAGSIDSDGRWFAGIGAEWRF